VVLFLVSCLTFAYIISDLPLLSNSSISSHCLSHHSALAFSVSLLSSLFNCLYLAFPTSVCLLLHFLLSLIFCNMASVTHGFLVRLPFLKPTCFSHYVKYLLSAHSIFLLRFAVAWSHARLYTSGKSVLIHLQFSHI